METITIFLSGDVMPGRGIDHILAHPCPPDLHEPYVKTAAAYRELAEEVNGPIPRPVSFDYIWGDALGALTREAPDLRIVNLETAVTRSEEWWRGKSIHYRMSPQNARCLLSAGIDACSLANNHVLDWDYPGLFETLDTLSRLRVRTAGAGRNLSEAEAPAILDAPGRGRVLLFAFGSGSSGIPSEWAASPERAGINYLGDLSDAAAHRIGIQVQEFKREGDIAVASIHWGGNWGYRIPQAHRAFARKLIEAAGIDLIHGHSSHHVLGIEVYQGKLILYGCGDFLTDYEGISGHKAFRGDLGLMYFARLRLEDGRLERLRMVPSKMRRFRSRRASVAEAAWLRRVLNGEGALLGTRVEQEDGILELAWQ